MIKRLKDLSILVVDDEKELRDLLAEQLQNEGAILYRAGDVASAIAIVKGEKIDLILSDILMARGDGIELLKKVKQLPYQPKVILMTGFSRYTLDELKGLGSVAVLTKPFELSDLVQEIGRLNFNP